MNDEDIKKLEEIEAAVGLNYCFTTDNWAGKQARSPQQDERWLIAKVKEQDQALADCKAVYAAHGTETEKQIDELQDELSACKERVGELMLFLRVVSECAKRKSLITDAKKLMKKYRQALQAQEQSKEVGG